MEPAKFDEKTGERLNPPPAESPAPVAPAEDKTAAVKRSAKEDKE